MDKLKVGTKIKIVSLYESSEYRNSEGTITRHPYPGVLYGTWGKNPVFPMYDKIEVVEECGES